MKNSIRIPLLYLWFAVSALALGGCATIPHEGPSRDQVEDGQGFQGDSSVNYTLVNLDGLAADAVGRFYASNPNSGTAVLPPPSPIGTIGPGDRLEIFLWEAGQGGLFSAGGGDSSDGGSQGAQRTLDFTAVVDQQGMVSVPYAGRIKVVDLTATEVEAAIVARLKGRSAQPQVSVQVMDNVVNTVMVEGAVKNPGRYPLLWKGATLFDLVSTAGGLDAPLAEVVFKVTRERNMMHVPATEVVSNSTSNIALSPGDIILALIAPTRYYAFGAVKTPGLQAFDEAHPTLLTALGTLGGLDDERADAKGVFIFRNEPAALKQQLLGSVARELSPNDRLAGPVVYQLNMRDPNSFFALNNFPIQPSDIIYVANAPLVEFGKFMRIVTGLTSGVAGSVALPLTLAR